MKVLLILGLFISAAAFSQPKVMPNYDKELLVDDATERSKYLSALKIEWDKNKIPKSCNPDSGWNWNFYGYFLDESEYTNNAKKLFFYKLKQSDPLFVIRMLNTRGSPLSHDAKDFLVYTTEDFSKITGLKVVYYKSDDGMDNIGSLAKPKLVKRNPYGVKKIEDCYSSNVFK